MHLPLWMSHVHALLNIVNLLFPKPMASRRDARVAASATATQPSTPPKQPRPSGKNAVTPSSSGHQQVLSRYFTSLPTTTTAPLTPPPSQQPKHTKAASATRRTAKPAFTQPSEVVSVDGEEDEEEAEEVGQVEERMDEVDEVMNVAGGQGGLFSQYAFPSAANEPHKPEQVAVVDEQPSGRKRKRGAAAQREDNKENEPQSRTRRSTRSGNTRRKRTADDDDEWMAEDELAVHDDSEEQAAAKVEQAEEKEEEMDEDQPIPFLSASQSPAVDFPTHFTSDPKAHAANVRRFEDRDALDEATDADSSHDAPPSSSAAAIDLTSDTARATPSSKAAKVKYTPLELQVLESKRKHPDLLLLFEVGYKYRFFGRDAEVAAKHLSIIAHPSHNFLTASVPTFRLLVHVRTLVEAGWKVGVVRQVESAAQKRLEGSSGTFSRKLCEVYSQATFLDEVQQRSDASSAAAATSETASRYIMVLYEEPGISNFTRASSSTPFFDASQVVVHVLAFDPITGSVVYDSFDDMFMRNQLDTRLRQLEPVELLLSDSGKLLSKNSWNVVNAWRDEQDVVRVERLSAHKYAFDFARATAVVTDYYTSASTSSASASASLDFALSLPKGPLVCLSVLIPYLQAFHLNSAFLLSSNFRPFSNNNYMLLNNSALYNLDILACSSPLPSTSSQSAAAARKGSLLWLLDHTKTSFGSRLMRQWVTHPLLSAPAIEQRLDAVGELMDAGSEWVSGLATLLGGLPDLERGLSRIHYSTAKPKEFLLLLQAYQNIVETLPVPSAVSSARLSHLLASVDREEVSEVLSFFLTNLDASALDATDKLARSRYYTDAELFPSLAARKQAITQHEQHMRTLLLDIRRLLGPAYSSLEYKSVLTSQYLVEVNPSDVRRLPADWLKVNSTKAKVRYHTPAIKDGWVALTRAEELLEEESDRCWQLFLQRFASHYALFRGLINVLSELDCLLSFATVSVSAGYVRPALVDGERVLDVDGLRHPMSELSVPSYVPNDCRMSESAERLMLITGPNMGGHTADTTLQPTRKCFVRGTRVRLYNGDTVAVEDIKGGERLMGDDGLPRIVTRGSIVHKLPRADKDFSDDSIEEDEDVEEEEEKTGQIEDADGDMAVHEDRDILYVQQADAECQVCHTTEAEGDDIMLLCDGSIDGQPCQRGAHLQCIGLTQVPEGSWYCEWCQPDGAWRLWPASPISSPEIEDAVKTLVSRGDAADVPLRHRLSLDSDALRRELAALSVSDDTTTGQLITQPASLLSRRSFLHDHFERLRVERRAVRPRLDRFIETDSNSELQLEGVELEAEEDADEAEVQDEDGGADSERQEEEKLYRITPRWDGAKPFTVNGAHILVLVNNVKPMYKERTDQRGTYRVLWYELDAHNRLRERSKTFYGESDAQAEVDVLLGDWEPVDWEVSVKDFLGHAAYLRRLCMLISCKAITFHNPALSSLQDVLTAVLDHQPTAAQLEYMAWWLGMWLTDGSSSSAWILQGGKPHPRPHSHQQIMNRLLAYQQLFNEPVDQVYNRTASAGWPAYYFKYRACTVAFRVLREYGLLNNKHMPRALICDSLDVRRRLLAGIIDGDGYYTREINTYEIASKHDYMCVGYKELAATLGLRNGAVRVHDIYIGQQTGDSEIEPVTKRPYHSYRVTISGDMWDAVQHCAATYKQCPEPGTDDYVERTKDSRSYGFKITELPPGEYFGFAVHGGVNQRFLLEDYIVTHNSSYIRSVALLVLMAQVGVYVPATSARLSVFDAIHTRMGARDSLHTGHSTFLMELAETQHMLSHATPRSLLIFDELGRGTSTHDGVAIAFACMEWVITRLQAFTLLVTHYQVLAKLADTHRGAVSVHHMSFLSDSGRTAAGTDIADKEERKDEDEEEVAAGAVADDDVDVVFMYSLVPGVAPRSFGLNVARLAHVKEEVVRHAAAIAHRRRSQKEVTDTSGEQLDAMARELDELLLSM